MAIYKNANLDISVAAEQNPNYNAKPSVQFSTQDKNTAKYTFAVKQNNKPVDLTGVTASVTLFSEDKSVFQSDANITNATEGKIEYVIPADAIRHHGKTRGDLRLTYPNGDVLGGLRFTFNIEQALIDRAAGVVGGVYIRDFETLKAEIQKTADSIKDIDVVRIDTKLNELEQKVEEGGVGVDEQARQEIQRVDTKLTETSRKLDSPVINLAEKGAVWGQNANDALTAALAAIPSTGGTIEIGGNIKLTKDFTIDKKVILKGFGAGRVASTVGTTVTLDGCSITFNTDQSGAKDLNFDGNNRKGKGLWVRGGHCSFENVLVTYMEGHGLLIGDEVNKTNANGVKLTNFISRFNGGDGIKVISKNGVLPDSNVIIFMGVTSSRNLGNGITLNNSIDNKFLSVSVEENKGYGIKLENQSGGHFFLSPYMEYNELGELYADDTCVHNMMFGNRRDAAIQQVTFANPNNMVMGRDNLLGLFPLFNKISTRELNIANPSPGGGNNGYWQFAMEAATRIMSFGIKEAPAAMFKILNDLQLEGQLQLSAKGTRYASGKAIRNVLYTSDTAAGTITIPPNSYIKSEKVLAGIGVSDTYSMNSQVPDGVIASAKIIENKVVFYYHNLTSTEKTFLVDSVVTVFKTVHA